MPSQEAQQVLAPYEQFLGLPHAVVAADLDSFHELLTTWNSTHNLVSRETVEVDFWQRHVADSLRILPLLRAADRRLMDIGSGGGFPALPLAIALKGTPRTYRLVEPSARKASFLRMVIRTLGLDASVDRRRAEQIDSRETTADVITARAVAPLGDLFGLAAPFLPSGARGLFHKGREYDVELQVAARRWRFDVLVHQDAGSSSGVVLEITNLAPNQ